MKTILTTWALCGTLGVLLAGCGKSGDPGAKTTSSAGSQARVSDEPVRLQVKWQTGQRYVQRMELAQESEITVPMQKPVKQSVTLEQESGLSVLSDRPGGGHEVEMEFQAIAMDAMMGETKMLSFDSQGESSNEAQNPVAPLLRALLGAKLKFFLDASNQVERVEGYTDFAARFTKKMRPEVRGLLEGMFSEASFKQMMGHGRFVPPGPVKPGDSWPVKTDMEMGPLGKLEMDLTYTFKDWELHDKARCVRLEFDGTLNSTGTNGAGPMGATLAVQNGKMSGQAWFDPDRGQMAESNIRQKMMVVVSFPQAPGGGAAAPLKGQSITNALDQKITVKITPLTAPTG
jgi:hypothetical protein